MMIGTMDTWRERFQGDVWRTIFDALENLSSQSAVGRTNLRGDEIYMMVQQYPTKPVEEAKIEAHRQYIDLQMTLDGKERIDWYVLEGLEVHTPYDESRDAAFFHRPAPDWAIPLNMIPGRFGIFFAEDAHSPQIAVDAPQTVRKVVVKIRRDLVHIR